MHIIKICAFFLVIGITQEFTILRDDKTQGLVFQTDRLILHQTSELQLNFIFNLTDIENIDQNLPELCPEGKNEIRYIQNTIKSMNSTWRIETEEILPKNTTKIFTPEMVSLRYNLISLPHLVCKRLTNISRILETIHDDFLKLKRLQIDDIFRLITTPKIKTELNKLWRYKRVFEYGFSTGRWFIRDLILQMTSEFQYYRDNVYLMLRLPLFEKDQKLIYRVYPKPITWDNKVFLYKNEMSHVIVDRDRALRFTPNEHKKYCFDANSKFFCRQFIRSKNTCDEQYLQKIFWNKSVNFNETCFDRLKNTDMITQIHNQFYFLLFHPMDIEVKLGQTHFTTRIYESSKIIEVVDYEFRTDFFYYTPFNRSKYQIYFSPVEVSFGLSFNFYKNGTMNVLEILILIITISGMVKLMKAFYSWKRNRQVIMEEADNIVEMTDV